MDYIQEYECFADYYPSIKVKYFDEACKISIAENGDWIDLRSSIDLIAMPNSFHLIPLGVAIELPDGYEAHLAPRSSSFKNYGFIQTNSVGVIDESYCGNNDEWKLPAWFLRFGTIAKGDRIAQFRIMKKMEIACIEEVEKLTKKDRGGFGSSGRQ